MTPEQIKRLHKKIAEAKEDLAYVDRREYMPPNMREAMRQSAEAELAFYEAVLMLVEKESGGGK